jgi:hypothetical protein
VTYLSWDSTSYYSVVGEVDEQNHEGLVWKFLMPGYDDHDTTYTPGIDLSGGDYGTVMSVVATYLYPAWQGTGDAGHVMLWFEQAPINVDSLYAGIWPGATLESNFQDSTGATHSKNVYFGGLRYLRFGVATTVSHSIANGDSTLTLYVTVSPKSWSEFKQGGVAYASKVIVPNPIYPDYYFELYWNPTGDSLRFAVANTNSATLKNAIGFRFFNRLDIAATVRTEDLLFTQDTLSYFSLGDWKPCLVGHDVGAKTTYDTLFFYHSAQSLKGSFIDTLSTVYGESLDTIVVKTVRNMVQHRRWPTTGPWFYPRTLVKQCFIWFRPSWNYSDYKMVKFVGGNNFSINSSLGDTVFCDGKEDIVFFTKYYGDAPDAGKWILLEHWNGDDD